MMMRANTPSPPPLPIFPRLSFTPSLLTSPCLPLPTMHRDVVSSEQLPSAAPSSSHFSPVPVWVLITSYSLSRTTSAWVLSTNCSLSGTDCCSTGRPWVLPGACSCVGSPWLRLPSGHNHLLQCGVPRRLQ